MQRKLKTGLKKGYIGRIDFYVGEIFQGSYSGVYSYLKDVAKGIMGGSAYLRIIVK